MPQENDVTIGTREFGGATRPVSISCSDRRHHCYVVGKTGVGKTTLLLNLILQDIEAGRGVGLIDPHGDLASALLDLIPRNRIEDVVYFDPADESHAIGLNILTARHDPHLTASGIVSAMKGVWRESWGPRLEYVLYATIVSLLECDNVSLLGVQRMLSDVRYRVWVMKQIKDPVVRSFWVKEFESYDRRIQNEIVAPIQNKIGQLLMAPKLRNILGQVKRKIDARFMMDKKRIFIANLSKGNLGEDKANLLGALLVTEFHLAALSRVNQPEEKREDFHLFVDEFQSFASETFASILSEARKYRLCLTVSHQYTDQLLPGIQTAVFGNVGSLISFRVGQRDAELLEREYGKEYPASKFTDLNNHEICLKIMSDGAAGQPFLGKTLPTEAERHYRRETILRRSREKYGTKKDVVEEKINRWLAKPFR